ncbi:helix-turn-helix domain-containing protein [SAR202 cluster bacterium AD-812-D07_MRT_10900m]|nr:helix-turn-helix domain-containing protein [SAR202 cluster bacterium AD-812-D07_MRT_10900m]
MLMAKCRKGSGVATERLAYTPEQTRRLLGLGRTTMYNRIADGTIPSVRIGSRILIPKRALEQLLNDTVSKGTSVNREEAEVHAQSGGS